jgi:hypothetical protein
MFPNRVCRICWPPPSSVASSLAVGCDAAPGLHDDAERSAQEAVARERSVEDDRAVAHGLDRRDIRLARGKVAERSGMLELAVVGRAILTTVTSIR